MCDYKKLEKYIPGPNDPDLPPQLLEFQNKSTDEVLEELNRMPFFMTNLDNTDGEGGNNVSLEALKALMYDGEPHEVATNFKNQGNALYKAKRYLDAREVYTQGIKILCDDNDLNQSLYSNRAACQLELKNFRSCINDCKDSLKFGPNNPKVFYRMGKAFLSLNKLREAEEAVRFGLRINKDHIPLKSLLDIIYSEGEKATLCEKKKSDEEDKKERLKLNLNTAISIRNFSICKTSNPLGLIENAELSLEDPNDIESQLIFPAMIMYPTIDKFDFIASVSELNTPGDLLTVINQKPHMFSKKLDGDNYTASKLIAYMETEDGGLIKAGKSVTFHNILKIKTPNIPLFDNALRIYFVPQSESKSWSEKWDKNLAIKRRH